LVWLELEEAETGTIEAMEKVKR